MGWKNVVVTPHNGNPAYFRLRIMERYVNHEQISNVDVDINKNV